MKKLSIVILISLSSFLSSNAYPINCSNPQNGYEISVCLGQEERAIDKELNQAYKKLISYTNNKKDLVKSELAWIKFRDTEAKFQSLSYKGGTEEKREYSRWIIRLTKERILHLKDSLGKM